MQHFYRSHRGADEVLALIARFFAERGFAAAPGAGDYARYSGPSGTVDVRVEVEGGHYTRVTLATREVGESPIDRLCKRCLAELHRHGREAPLVRGAY